MTVLVLISTYVAAVYNHHFSGSIVDTKKKRIPTVIHYCYKKKKNLQRKKFCNAKKRIIRTYSIARDIKQWYLDIETSLSKH